MIFFHPKCSLVAGVDIYLDCPCSAHHAQVLAPVQAGEGLPHAVVDAVHSDEHTRALRDHGGEPSVAEGQGEVIGEVGEDSAKPGLRVTDL